MTININLDKCLGAVMQWIAIAQDAHTEDQGISAAYHLLWGWRPSYPETTGYIINTLLAYYRCAGKEEYKTRAVSAGEWLLGLQMESGAFPGGLATSVPVPRVFNTGMILFGLSELDGLTHDSRYQVSIQKALDWLVKNQDQDGSWTSVSSEKKPHVYHSRVAWGMLEAASSFSVEEQKRYRQSIIRAIEWVLTQQDSDGWFRHNELIEGMPPLTHNIAYTLRGLVEVGAHLKRDDLINSAYLGAEKLWSDFETHGYLSAGYTSGWRRQCSFRCITGEVQIGLVWFRIYQILGEKKYDQAARKILLQAAETQFMVYPPLKYIYGAIPGSSPLWGGYLRLAYPNWAAKFYADLLMLTGVCA